MGVLTSSEAALVNPGMHVCALILELLKLIGGVLDFVLEILDLIDIGSDGIVECLGQWIGGGFHCRRSDWTGGWVDGCQRTSARSSIITLIAGSGGSELQFVLRIETAGVLGVFIWGTLYLLRVVVVCIFGIGSGRHWKILLAFGRAISRQTTKPGHDRKEERKRKE